MVPGRCVGWMWQRYAQDVALRCRVQRRKGGGWGGRVGSVGVRSDFYSLQIEREKFFYLPFFASPPDCYLGSDSQVC